MPAYAGYNSLGDYLERRCGERGLSFNQMSGQMGWTHSYLAGLAKGDFNPSRQRADTIAKFFGDNPRLVRILAGLEIPPTEDDRDVAAIRDVAASLSDSNRRELLRYAKYLKGQQDR